MSTNPPEAPPPPLALYQMAVGHYTSRALYLAAKWRIADHLADGADSAEALAERTGTRAEPLRRLLRLLVANGVFEEAADGRFASTAMGEALRSDDPDSMRASVMLFCGVGIQDSWKELEFCVQTGEPAFRRANPDAVGAFDDMAQDPEEAALFDEAMAGFTRRTAAVVAAMHDFSRYETLVDVGGGNGALLIGVLQAHPHLSGRVFDLPDAAKRAQREIEAAGLAERCEAVGGDFFDSVPSGADAYLIKHVIHDWNDERAGTILACCREAMGPDNRLLIVEGVYPEHVDRSLESLGAAQNDVNMLVVAGGRQRSEAEFRRLLDDAGLELVGIQPTPARVAILEARRR